MAHLTKHITETLTLGDAKKKGSSKRITEFISMTEGYTRKLSRHFHESLTIADVLRRSANAVMYDVVIRDDVLTKDDLDSLFDSPPVGHTPFSILHPGDYKYTKGIVGIRVQGGTGLGRAGVEGLKLNVDTPDVYDTGTAAVTTDPAGTFVPFNRTFTVIPTDVFPQFTSGASAALTEVLGVTLLGFTVILRDVTSPATLVAGNITWQVKGR